jgi:hypothetical protein
MAVAPAARSREGGHARRSEVARDGLRRKWKTPIAAAKQ